MKMQAINKLVTAAFIASLGFAATSAFATQDTFQRDINQRLMKSQQQLTEIKAAMDATERQKLMSEHMKNMQEIMDQVQAMKPKEGMSMQEHEDWINEHMKLMDKVMGQMMEEHHMLMGPSDKHKH